MTTEELTPEAGNVTTKDPVVPTVVIEDTVPAVDYSEGACANSSG